MKESLENFAKGCYRLGHSDRDVNIGCAGFTGEGKTTFLIQFALAYEKVSRVNWGFNSNMTWARSELLVMIDGKKGAKPSRSGLRPGQLPQYSFLLVDELWLLFYKRNWFENAQIEAIATLNMCRDRRLVIGGNVPNFWDLDGAFLSRIRYYAFIPKRGVAWIFEQESNPFASDPWNRNMNRKIFRKGKVPYGMPNFVCEIHFPDLTPAQKDQYLRIRNEKRLKAIEQHREDAGNKYRNIRKQRDIAVKLLFDQQDSVFKDRKAAKELGIKRLSNKYVADLLNLSNESVRKARAGAGL